MKPSPRNSIKIEEIDNKSVIHALTMNNNDKYQSSSREEPPYTLYEYTRKDTMLIKSQYILPIYRDKGVQ